MKRIILTIIIILTLVGCTSYTPYRNEDNSINIAKEVLFITAFGIVSACTVNTTINNKIIKQIFNKEMRK